MGRHQCNRSSPEPAIAKFFYRPPTRKSRLKLANIQNEPRCNYVVIISAFTGALTTPDF
jgi:hypothetical protein